MKLSEKITDLRRKAGWSQEELAEKLDVTRQSVSKWESGASTPDISKIVQMSRIFNVSCDFLLKEEEFPKFSTDAVENSAKNVESVRWVDISQAKEYLALRRAAARKIAASVFACIISPSAMLALIGAAESGRFGISEDRAVGIGIGALIFLVAIACVGFVTCEIAASSYEFLEKEDFELESGASEVVQNDAAEFLPRYSRFNALGCFLCVLAAIPVIAVGCSTEDVFYIMLSLVLTLLSVGIGVVFFCYAGVIRASQRRLLQEAEYSAEGKRKTKKAEAVGTVYWLIVVALYLGYSFITMNWHISWVIWPIAGILFGIIDAIIALTSKK